MSSSDNDFQLISTLDPSHLPLWPSSSPSSPAQEHHILILDSSHNPPTLAHAHLLATALLHPPPPCAGYTAVLLLLATHNADKGHLSPRALAHRKHLMHLLARHIRPGGVPTAIATTPRALFADKAHALLAFLKTRSLGLERQSRLDWITGDDTLVRILHPKYYPAGASVRSVIVDGFLVPTRSRLVVAPRPHVPVPEGTDVELQRELQDQGLVVHLDGVDASKVDKVSSSLVRQLRQHCCEGEWQQWVVPEVAEYVAREGLYLPHDRHHEHDP